MFHADFNFLLLHLFKPQKYIFIYVVIAFLARTQTLFYSSFRKHRQALERARTSPSSPTQTPLR